MAAEDEVEVAEAPVAPEASAPVVAGPSAPTASPLPNAPDISNMVISPEKLKATQERLLQIQQQKTAANAANSAEVTSRLDTDRARMEAAYKASSIIPEEIQKGWDSNKKSAEYYTDPVEAFGSVGSVFALLASSFAGLPMEHALNAGAKAINAVHEGDARGYEREYAAWQKNTDLAIKRHEMQRQAYNDATTLMNSNLNAGRSKMELAATRFGDQKAQALLEAGMDKELTDLFMSRSKAALGLTNTWDKVQLEHEKVQDLRNDPRYNNPAEKAAAIQEWTQRWSQNGASKARYDAEADYIAAQKRANPNWTPDDMLQWKKDYATAEEGTGGSGSKTGAGNRAAEIARRRDEYVAQGMPATEAYNKAAREVGMTNATPSGNRLSDDKSMVDQMDTAIATIEKQKDYLKKYGFITGAGGMVTRVGEKIGNVMGLSSNTDRQDFEKNVEKLRLTASRLLTLSRGRPLAAEAARINKIVSGKEFGDTGASTIRAMEELETLYRKMQADVQSQVGDTWNPPPTAGGPPAEGRGSRGNSSSGKPKWQSAPIVSPATGPRSDLGAEADTAYG